MFFGAASKLKAIPKNGDEVAVKGELSVYATRGNYQIVIRELKPAGVGALLQRLEELKREIHQRVGAMISIFVKIRHETPNFKLISVFFT